MTTRTAPKFYKPVFGNDNFTYGLNRDVVDIADFASPAMDHADVALAPARKVTEHA